MKTVGILTFHCADNFGAMLQAYGLKAHLRELGFDAEIINYCPPFMTGRHWWIPYVPASGTLGNARLAFTLAQRNLKQAKALSLQKKNMKAFRKKYLCANARKLRFFPPLKKLSFDAYVLGSDQIWNPALTYGLRPAYFGAFAEGKSPRPTVISYAASFGGNSLDDCYREELAGYLGGLDAVSLREPGAIPFLREICGKEAAAVPDPVFLPGRECWERLLHETQDAAPEHYIFYCETENRQDMRGYAERLSSEKHLPVCELRYRKAPYPVFENVIYTAGPAEFLALLSRADYVVTNSFHAISLSIIFEKRFAAFPHSDRNSRLSGVLQAHELEGRIAGEKDFDIDAAVDWTDVGQKSELLRKQGTDFLMKYLQSHEDDAQ